MVKKSEDIMMDVIVDHPYSNDEITYDKMPDFTSTYSRVFKGGNKFFEIDHFYNFHVGYRKCVDTPASAIVWNVMSIMKDGHRKLLVDTIKNYFPKSMDRDDKKQIDKFGHVITNLWEIFEHRVTGMTVEKDEKGFNRPFIFKFNNIKRDTYNSVYSEMYRTLMSNLFIAGSRVDKPDSLSGLSYAMYGDK
jgi:hypothetical protein